MNRESFVNDMRVLKQFFHRELIVLKKELYDTMIDALIWPIMTAFIWGYVTPVIGISSEYGTFIFVGTIAGIWFYSIIEKAFLFIQASETTRMIDYELTLPVSPQLVFIKYGLSFALHSFVITFPLLFVGKLCLYDRFDMSAFSFPKFVFISVVGNVICAFFALWVAGLTRTEFIIHIRIRLFDPLFYFGCNISTWATLHSVFPFIANLMLLNPVTYCMEGLRVAVFGQAGYINFWICIGVLTLQTLIFVKATLKTFKKRFDFVAV
jgi:hypothetical protein